MRILRSLLTTLYFVGVSLLLAKGLSAQVGGVLEVIRPASGIVARVEPSARTAYCVVQLRDGTPMTLTLDRSECIRLRPGERITKESWSTTVNSDLRGRVEAYPPGTVAWLLISIGLLTAIGVAVAWGSMPGLRRIAQAARMIGQRYQR